MFTTSNAVLVALIQIGVIVIGILAAGVSNKIWTDTGVPVTSAALLLLEYGVALLLIPVVWICSVMAVHQRNSISEETRNLTFWSGTVFIVSLAVFELYAIFSPWLCIFHGGFDAPGGFE